MAARSRALKFGAALALVLLVALVAVATTFSAATLPVSAISIVELPRASPPEGMRISAIPTGSMESKAGFAFRGGAFADTRLFAMTSVLVQHPKGNLLIDAGFGRRAAEHAQMQPWLVRTFSSMHFGRPIVDQLPASVLADLGGVVLTHAHWDHVSGALDLPKMPLWMAANEIAYIRDGKEATELLRGFDAPTLHEFAFNEPAYFGYEKSFDVYGDGAIVVVPAGGHTPGSVVVFVALPSGRRFAFIGDLAWQSEGVTIPAERPLLLRMMVDFDPAKVRSQLSHLAALHQRFPELEIVPAHDERAFATIAVYPAVSR